MNNYKFELISDEDKVQIINHRLRENERIIYDCQIQISEANQAQSPDFERIGMLETAISDKSSQIAFLKTILTDLMI